MGMKIALNFSIVNTQTSIAHLYINSEQSEKGIKETVYF